MALNNSNSEVDQDIDKIIVDDKLVYNINNKVQGIYENATKFFKQKPISDYLENRKKIYDNKELDINNQNKFCIFEAISTKYFRETFHSDIIAMLLDPKTREIGDIHFFVYFLKYLGLLEKGFDVEKDAEKFDVVVHKEEFTGAINGKKGYMDITCYYKDKRKSKEYDRAILIENKINYAPDMEDQLVRYMQCINAKVTPKIKKLTVVYLTLRDDKKVPDPSSYDSQHYGKEIDDIKHSLKRISAVSPTEDIKESLVDGFLKKCLDYLDDKIKKNYEEKHDLIRVFIKQYKLLLNHLGGDAYMARTAEELILDIYKDEELFNTMDSVSKIWNDRDKILSKIITNKVEMDPELGKNKTMVECNWHNKKEYYRCWQTKVDHLFIYFYDGYNFGFVRDDNESIDDSVFESFKDLDTKLIISSKLVGNSDWGENWFGWNINIDNINVVDDTIKNLKYLVEKCNKNSK